VPLVFGTRTSIDEFHAQLVCFGWIDIVDILPVVVHEIAYVDPVFIENVILMLGYISHTVPVY